MVFRRHDGALGRVTLAIRIFRFLFHEGSRLRSTGEEYALHVEYTALRPENDADKARAAALVTNLRDALAKYQDYHVAEADDFAPFAPESKVPVVRFWKHSSGLKPAVTFDPGEPYSLLYQPTPGGGYKLIGATYVSEKGASEDQLNRHVPLSVARWSRDVNLCRPALGTDAKTTDWTKFD